MIRFGSIAGEVYATAGSLERNPVRDAETLKALITEGWRFLVIWE